MIFLPISSTNFLEEEFTIRFFLVAQNGEAFIGQRIGGVHSSYSLQAAFQPSKRFLVQWYECYGTTGTYFYS